MPIFDEGLDRARAYVEQKFTELTTRAEDAERGEAESDAKLAIAENNLTICKTTGATLQALLDTERANHATTKKLLDAALKRIAELETTPPVVVENEFRPISFTSLDEAKRVLNAPADANYVVWKNEWTHLEQAFAALSANDILVLPERDEPYLIDSSKGFMASGISAVTGSANGVKTPIVSNSRLWFAMSRARRGILGLGPRVVIKPSESSWTAPAQPKPMYAFNSAGVQTQELVGANNKLIENDHANSFFANFEIQGRDFGGVAYNAIALTGTSYTVKRIYFNGAWRGFSGVPNGETGGLTFLKGTYDISNLDFRSVNGPSPIMWNRTTGGKAVKIRHDRPNYGMLTFWRCGGTNVFEDVRADGNQIGINLEEELAGFVLNWTDGYINIADNLKGFHLNMNPSGGSQKVTLKNVKATLNGYTPGALSAHVYTTGNTQKKADVTWDGPAPISYLPANYWS